jgi:hypothetical protein
MKKNLPPGTKKQSSRPHPNRQKPDVYKILQRDIKNVLCRINSIPACIKIPNDFLALRDFFSCLRPLWVFPVRCDPFATAIFLTWQ